MVYKCSTDVCVCPLFTIVVTVTVRPLHYCDYSRHDPDNVDCNCDAMRRGFAR